jgi:voltage-gated potassium channel
MNGSGMNNPWRLRTGRHVAILLALSVFLLCFGIFGYMILEGYSFIEALFMTVITLSTVGFGETRPLDGLGRIFTIVLIMLGASFVAYNISFFTQLLLDGNLLQVYRRIKVLKKLEQLEDHYIICGYGQMGQIVANELIKHRIPALVLENDEAAILRLQEKGIPYFSGDATEEESLITAGVRKAKGLVAVVSKDPDNVFIVLTARDLNKELLICARAAIPGTEKRLLKAGADHVVSPYASGAVRIAQQILRPTVTDFLELAISGTGMELSMEELHVPEAADIIGKDLIHSGIRKDYNLIIVAIKRNDGKMIYNPSPMEVINSGDILITIGPQENLRQFAQRMREGNKTP